MALFTRSGRARPQGGGFELFVWYLIRLSGLALFVLALAHFSILHFLYDPAEQDTNFITTQRWSQHLLAGDGLAAAHAGDLPQLPGRPRGGP